MVADELIEWLFVVPNLLIAMLPTCAGLGWDFTGMGDLSGYMGPVALFMDVSTWGTVLGLMLATETAMLVVRVALWAWRLTPLSG